MVLPDASKNANSVDPDPIAPSEIIFVRTRYEINSHKIKMGSQSILLTWLRRVGKGELLLISVCTKLFDFTKLFGYYLVPKSETRQLADLN